MKQSEELEKMDKFAMVSNRRRRRKCSFVPASQAPPPKKRSYHLDLTQDDSDSA